MSNPILQMIGKQMNNNSNPMMQMMQMMMTNKNNPNAALDILRQNNPQANQLLQGVDANNSNVMEQLCRNLCNMQGKDFNTEYNKILQMFNTKVK